MPRLWRHRGVNQRSFTRPLMQYSPPSPPNSWKPSFAFVDISIVQGTVRYITSCGNLSAGHSHRSPSRISSRNSGVRVAADIKALQVWGRAAECGPWRKTYPSAISDSHPACPDLGRYFSSATKYCVPRRVVFAEHA